MTEPFVGEIRPFGFNFAPRGWALCNGQLLSIAQNTALFSLLGTQFGGNGTTTFGVPDFQNRLSVSQGQGPGLQSWTVGQSQGVNSVTLLQSQLGSHSHALQALNVNATSADPAARSIAKGAFTENNQGGAIALYQTAAPNVQMNAQAIGPTGGNQSHNNVMPCLVINICIALEGIFPPRP